MRSIREIPSLIAVLALLAVPAHGENWPQWRGPHFDGVSHETGLPGVWSYSEQGQKNIAWRVDLPGPGTSTPIVWGDHIFLTSTEKAGETVWVLAFDRDGNALWKTRADSGSFKVIEQFAHETNAAAPSPVTDGELVWALFGTGKLVALDFAGKIRWTVDLAERYGKPNMYFGFSASPLLYGEHLYLHWLHTDAQLVFALDKKTGEEVWKQERATDATGECLHSYASLMPFVPAGGKPQVLVHGADYLSAHHPKTGDELWRYGTLNPKDNYNTMFRLVSTPVSADGLIVVPTAKRGPVFGLRPGADVKAGSIGHAWKLNQGTPDVPSPLIAGDLVYLAGENGRLAVLDARTGDTVYAERVHQSQHRGSPVLADGKLFLTATDGTVSVVRAGRKFEVLAKNKIDGERLSASPAVSGGRIYLRTYDGLFAVTDIPDAGGSKGEPASSRP